jgi:quinol monooxygenase YgiN
MAGFIQIIEFQTSRFDQFEAIDREARSRLDDGSPTTPVRITVVGDRDRPGHFMSIVEFESHEAAMANSSRPEVGEFATKLTKLCDAPPRFYNLDVQNSWQPTHS